MESLAPHLPLVLSFLGGGLFGLLLGYALHERAALRQREAARDGDADREPPAEPVAASAAADGPAPTVPAKPAPADAAEPAWGARPATPALDLWQDDEAADRPSVLLADDRLELLAMHAAYLRKHGYRVLLAEDAASALAFARAYHPSLIVLDHSMPDRTGVEVARELKADEDTMDIPILLMTAHSFGAVGNAAMAAGCSGFLTKPVEPSRLLREIEARTTRH